MVKKPGKKQGQDLGELALEIARRRQGAAQEVLELLQQRFGEHPAHPETVLYAAAWLAGTSLYRSLGIPAKIEPGSAVLSDQANEEGPKLLNVFATLLRQFGISVEQKDLVYDVPRQHRAEIGILEVQAQLQEPYNAIMKKYGFDYREGARTGAVACALLAKAFCRDAERLPLGLAAGIVSMGFVEGSKTAPMPIAV